MTADADPSPALERLADAGRVATPARRMRVIVNPYATTMSARLKQLVVYALQGRFDVDAVDTERRDHATELAPRRRATRAMTSSSPSGATAPSTRPPTASRGSPHALTCLPGGATNVYCRMLGIPTDVVDATEHLLRLADDWRPRAVDLGRSTTAGSRSPPALGLDASVVERVDSHPRLKARFGPFFYAQAASRRSCALRRQPAALEAESAARSPRA